MGVSLKELTPKQWLAFESSRPQAFYRFQDCRPPSSKVGQQRPLRVLERLTALPCCEGVGNDVVNRIRRKRGGFGQ